VDIGTALEAFFAEHERCGELDGGVEDQFAGYRVWMSCLTCGAKLDRHFPDVDDDRAAERQADQVDDVPCRIVVESNGAAAGKLFGFSRATKRRCFATLLACIVYSGFAGR
jgi:hypothetical protein